MKTSQVAKISQKKTVAKPSRLERWLPWIFVVCGIVGIIASAVITIEKFDQLKNPNATFICDLNPIISCGSVMESAQASTFGFMNPIIGLVGFPILVTIGVAMLAGARFKRWFWLGMLAGLSLGMVFAYYLLAESIFSIGALCPWCLTVDVFLTIAWWYLLLYVFGKGYLQLPTKLQRFGTFLRQHHLDIIIFWFLLVIVFILNHFWYYFGPNWFNMS